MGTVSPVEGSRANKPDEVGEEEPAKGTNENSGTRDTSVLFPWPWGLLFWLQEKNFSTHSKNFCRNFFLIPCLKKAAFLIPQNLAAFRNQPTENMEEPVSSL